jgi:hypothetical protein
MRNCRVGGRILALALLGFSSIIAAPAAFAQARDKASVVLVGHSLINYEMPEYLGTLASSKGLAYSKALQVIIGSPLRLNFENCRRATAGYQDVPSSFSYSCDAIESGTGSGPYDAVLVTEANNTLAGHRQYNNTDEYVARYMELLRGRNPAGRTLLFTTWEALPTYGASWGAKQAADLAAYEEVARSAAQIAAGRGTGGTVEVVPVNIALRDLLARIASGGVPGVTSRDQIFMDDVHMTRAGNYFVACVVFAVLYNRSPEGATEVVPSPYAGQPALVDLSGGAGRAMQRLAWDVVSTYRTGGVAVRPKPPGSLQVQ